MKPQPQTPPSKANKELKQFAIIGLALSAVGLFVLWFLGIVGLAFSVRALMLAFHESNKTEKNVTTYSVIAIVGIVFGILDVIGGLSA